MEELRLNRPPITEAVIEIRTENAPGLTVDELKKIELPGYAKTQDQVTIEGRFEVANEEIVTKGERTVIGYVYRNNDDKQICQVRLNVFSFSRLAPYGNWTNFSDEARKLWNICKEVIRPIRIVRISVRYINRIDIPAPVTDLSQYLRTYPEISNDMVPAVNEYFMRIQSPQSDVKATLVLHEAMVPPPSPDLISILLDIDLYRETDIPQEEEQIWDTFRLLRDKKNQIFKACLKANTLRLFD